MSLRVLCGSRSWSTGAPFLARSLRENWGFSERYLRTVCPAGSRTPASLASFAALSVGFPGEVRVAAAEVAVGRGLLVDRTAQIERLDDAARRQLEVRANQVRDNFRIDLLGAKGFDQHADRIGDADRVGQLHFAAVRESARDDVLRDVARHVSRRAIDLRRILAAENAPPP